MRIALNDHAPQNGQALKRMQAGVDKLASTVGVSSLASLETSFASPTPAAVCVQTLTCHLPTTFQMGVACVRSLPCQDHHLINPRPEGVPACLAVLAVDHLHGGADAPTLMPF